MQQDVLPLPIAPKMAIPVNKPRSGIVSQEGALAGTGLRGLCTSPTTRKRSSLLLGSGYLGRRPGEMVWRGEQKGAIEIFEAQECFRSTHGNDTEKNLLVGERMRIEKERTDGHGEDGRDEGARFECSLHQALPRASIGWALSGPGWAA